MKSFHGGCHGCTQQDINGIEFCYGCQYFDANWNKPDLNNRPPSEASIAREEVAAKVEGRGPRTFETEAEYQAWANERRQKPQESVLDYIGGIFK